MRQQRVSLFRDVALNGFKGLDISGPSELVGENFLADALNFEVGLKGELKKRPGIIRKHNGTTLGVNGVRFLGAYQNNTHQQLLVQTVVSGNSGKIYKSIDSGVTWTQISTPAGTNYNCTKGIQYLDVFYIPTTAGLLRWDGGTFFGLAAGTPNTVIPIAFAKFRIFAVDLATNNIKFSDAGNMLSYPAANTIGLPGDGDLIVAIFNYRDRLVILRNNSIYLLYLDGPPTSWILKKLSFNIGTTFGTGYTVYNDLIYLLSWDGVFRTDLSQFEDISLPIKSIFTKRRQTSIQYSLAWDLITYWNNRIICNIRLDNNSSFKCMVYNILNKTWTEWLPSLPTILAGPPPYSPIIDSLPIFFGDANLNPDTNKEGLYFITADANGKIYFFDDQDPVYQDEVNTAYLSRMKTKKIDNGESSSWKRAPVVLTRELNAGAGVQGRYYVNDSAGALFPIPTGAGLKEIKLKGPGFYRTVELEITDTTTNYFEIDDVVFRTKLKEVVSDAST